MKAREGRRGGVSHLLKPARKLLRMLEVFNGGKVGSDTGKSEEKKMENKDFDDKH